jgi:hypothetical protein
LFIKLSFYKDWYLYSQMRDITQLEMKFKIDKSWPHTKKSIKCCNYYSAMFNGFHFSIFSENFGLKFA